MKETSKAMRRRWCEHELGLIRWRNIFKEEGIDVGSGDDPLQLNGVTHFDLPDGDANKLSTYFAHDSFWWLHSSQCLEHMHNAKDALTDWIKIVKPGGWLIITVPSWELYEYGRWPSPWNPDHKSTWSMWTQSNSKCKQHIFVPQFLREFEPLAYTILVRQLDSNYDYSAPSNKDQTWNESDGVEPFIEFVLKKK